LTVAVTGLIQDYMIFAVRVKLCLRELLPETWHTTTTLRFDMQFELRNTGNELLDAKHHNEHEG
jgi:hypothetical protein